MLTMVSLAPMTMRNPTQPLMQDADADLVAEVLIHEANRLRVYRQLSEEGRRRAALLRIVRDLGFEIVEAA